MHGGGVGLDTVCVQCRTRYQTVHTGLVLYAGRDHHHGQCEVLFDRHGRVFGVHAVHEEDRQCRSHRVAGEWVRLMRAFRR